MPHHFAQDVLARPTHQETCQPVPQPSHPLVVTFVWTVWAAMLITALAFVVQFGSQYPYFDDFDIIPYLTARKPITAEWLWSQHEDHRLVLPRLFMIGSVLAAGGDFRGGSIFNVLAMAALAAGMILAAKKLRGRLAYSDAFFPLILLSWQGVQGLHLWTFSIQFVLPALLSGLMLILIVRNRSSLSPGEAIACGLCTIMLPLCGGTGVGLVPPFALWVVYIGACLMMSSRPYGKLAGAVTIGLALLASSLTVFYFYGLQRTASEANDPMVVLWTAINFLSNGTGMVAHHRWPYPLIAVNILVLVSCVVLFRAWYLYPDDRYRTTGLILFLGAFICLALGYGHARGVPIRSPGVVTRYIAAAVPLLCCVYFSLMIGRLRGVRFLHLCLMLFAALLVPLNAMLSLDSTKEQTENMAVFGRDLLAGAPAGALTERHWSFMLPADNPEIRQNLFQGIEDLKRTGMGQFRRVQDNPPVIPGMRIESKQGSAGALCFVPYGWHSWMSWDDIRWSGPEAEITFNLSRVEPLVIRLLATSYRRQQITLRLNDNTLGTFEFSGGEPEAREIPLPAEWLRPKNAFAIVAPGAKSPESVGDGDDGRVMGLGLVWVEFAIPDPG